MSDVMLFGILRMPFDLAMSDEISRHQYWQRGQQAANEIEKLRAEVERMREALVHHSEVLVEHSGHSSGREWHNGGAWLYPGDSIVVRREPLPPIQIVIKQLDSQRPHE